MKQNVVDAESHLKFNIYNLMRDKISSIEFLRFFASIMVLIWHYQHFYLPFNKFSEINLEDNNKYIQPLFDVLQLFYLYGYRGVDMFFILSGYVFSYVYIRDGVFTDGRKFFINRFARLYPLHLLTLIFVLILQIYSLNFHNQFIIYNNNDIYHFILNLFFISGWGLEKGASFNGPIWSVSIEIIAYSIFFYLIILYKDKTLFKTILILTILIFFRKFFKGHSTFNTEIISFLIFFFQGVLVFFLEKKFKSKKYFFLIGSTLFFFSLIGNFKIFLFFPGILIIFLYVENFLNDILKNLFNFLGQLTYSIYLWHVPVQISMILIIKKNEFLFNIVEKYNFLFLYILIVMLVSLLSFKYFESPFRKFLRNKFTNKKFSS